MRLCLQAACIVLLSTLPSCTYNTSGPPRPSTSSGGPGSGQPALAYTNPQGTGWLLVQNTGLSSPGKVVLGLVPPASVTSGRGVTLELGGLGTGLSWAKVAAGDSDLVENVAYTLLAPTDLPTASKVLMGITKGTVLEVAVIQKGNAGITPNATYNGKAVLTIAVQLNAAGGAQSGPQPAVTVLKASHLSAADVREDITSQVLVGTLTVN